MDTTSLLAFALAFFLFAASPGPDNMTIVAKTVSSGPASGLAYGLGTVIGILIYLGLAAFGLSLIASKMGLLMTILRYAGAAYLIYMAYRLWTEPPVIPELTPGENRPRNLAGVCMTAVALNLGNPKMPLFYLALLPGFVGTSFGMANYGKLASVIVLVECIVVGGHVWIADRARALLRTPAIVRRANRIAGSALALAGIQVLVTTRSS
ncbi:LysE family translocator [Rhizobium sp. SL42]|uniref:LysE family translocator n=1 Tax=Rhizobium sp. SL42 TaxID=2806346 RepID=UPI001F3F2EB6|nr:LysE family translocator [Rhizobium sp. SL42]UJW73934.1 LysE family translocator [Rhizobium sp. SL42]